MDDCIFCKIIKGSITSSVIDQDDDIMVIRDIAPKAHMHYLIIPKKHVKVSGTLEESDTYLVAKISSMAKKLSQQLHGSQSFRLIINNGIDAGQSVWHLHCHFISGNHLSDF